MTTSVSSWQSAFNSLSSSVNEHPIAPQREPAHRRKHNEFQWVTITNAGSNTLFIQHKHMNSNLIVNDQSTGTVARSIVLPSARQHAGKFVKIHIASGTSGSGSSMVIDSVTTADTSASNSLRRSPLVGCVMYCAGVTASPGVNLVVTSAAGTTLTHRLTLALCPGAGSWFEFHSNGSLWFVKAFVNAATSAPAFSALTTTVVSPETTAAVSSWQLSYNNVASAAVTEQRILPHNEPVHRRSHLHCGEITLSDTSFTRTLTETREMCQLWFISDLCSAGTANARVITLPRASASRGMFVEFRWKQCTASLTSGSGALQIKCAASDITAGNVKMVGLVSEGVAYAACSISDTATYFQVAAPTQLEGSFLRFVSTGSYWLVDGVIKPAAGTASFA